MTEPEVLIDGHALLQNIKIIQKNSGLPLFPVLKANAYGHGASLIAPLLEQNFAAAEIPYFCVARLREARELRAAGITRDLLILSHYSLSESPQAEEFPSAVALVVSHEEDVEALLKIPPALRKNLLGVHLNINTGMNRIGFRFDDFEIHFDRYLAMILKLVQNKISILGIMTHLACGEESPKKFSLRQLRRFASVCDLLRRNWVSQMGEFPKWFHVANSGGLFWELNREKGYEWINAGRPGLNCFGVQTSPKSKVDQLLPVMEVRAPVRQVFWAKKGESIGYGQRYKCKQNTLVGTVTLGYADGIDRRLSRNRPGQNFKVGFCVEGKIVPIVGTVSMDMTMVDLTRHPRAKYFAETLRSQTKLELNAGWICSRQNVNQIAQTLETISYEILCSVGHRVKRVLKEETR